MRSLLKFLALALVIVFLGLWIMTVSKSCNKSDVSKLPDVETGANDEITEVTDDIEDLFEEDSIEDGLFNEDGDEITNNDSERDGNTKGEFIELEPTDEGGEDLEEGGSSSTNFNNSRSSSDMEYLVIGGAFLTEANAVKEMRRLQKQGFDDAEVVTFDHSKYHSICVDRLSSLSDARSLKNRLIKSGNVEAYVHKKRKSKRK